MVGSLRATSAPRQGDVQLSSLLCDLDMDGLGSVCYLHFAGQLPSETTQGDELQIDLDGGDGAARVFSGEVFTVERSHSSVKITAMSSLSKLARLEVEEAYEEVEAGFIVEDLLDQAGLQAGAIERGPTFPSYTLHTGPRALQHLRHLAERCGTDLYADPQGVVHFALPRQGPPDHEFQYGQNILSLELWDAPMIHDGVVLWGEGAASKSGAERSHWLVTDPDSVSGKAAFDPSGAVTAGSEGDNPLVFIDGSVRSGETAQSLAEARATAMVSRILRGKLQVFGSPDVQPGDLVAIHGLPQEKWGDKARQVSSQPLRVRRVQHSIEFSKGFFTLIEF